MGVKGGASRTDPRTLWSYHERDMEKVFSWMSPKEATRAENRYWLTQSVEARVLATETILPGYMGSLRCICQPNRESLSAC